MTTLYLPQNPKITYCRFKLQTYTQRFISPLNQSTQTVKLPGDRWIATYTFAPCKRAEMANLQTFLLSLEGSNNTFYGYDANATTLLGTGLGTPLVNGASQTGSTLVTDGWGANSYVLRKGDYFQVGDELKFVTQDCLSDGSGNATINFKPIIRVSPADNAAVTVRNPRCKMKLPDDDQAVWEAGSANYFEALTIQAYEAFF